MSFRVGLYGSSVVGPPEYDRGSIHIRGYDTTAQTWVTVSIFSVTDAGLAQAEMNGFLLFESSEHDVETGSVTNNDKSSIILRAQSGTIDELDTLTNTPEGALVMLRPDSGDEITLEHGTGNLQLIGSSDFEMTGNDICLGLIVDGNFIEIGRNSTSDVTATYNNITVTQQITVQDIDITGVVWVTDKIDFGGGTNKNFHVIKKTITHTDLTDASTSQAVTVFNGLNDVLITSATIQIVVRTVFSGGGVTDVKMKLGTGADDDRWLLNMDVDSTISAGHEFTIVTSGQSSMLLSSVSNDILATFTATGGDVADLTAGELDIYLTLVDFP